VADSLPLLSAFAPRRNSVREAPFGFLPLVSFIAKGVDAGLKFIKSPRGKNYLAELGETEKKLRLKIRGYDDKARAESNPEAKARWERRRDRAQARLDVAVLKADLARRGIVGKGSVLEYKRNHVAASWDSADPESQKRIEGQVAKMDAELLKLHAEYEAEQQAAKQDQSRVLVPSRVQGSPARARGGSYARRLDITKSRRSGLGGMQFDVMAPPGPGRLVRIPFYVAAAADSWTTTGIDFVDDDPVARLLVLQGFNNSRPVLMETERFDYGSYRILGLQTNEQQTYRTIADIAGGQAPFTASVAITISEFSVYNGADLFLPDPVGEMASSTYNVLPSSTMSAFLPVGVVPASPIAPMETPYNYAARRNRWFAGFRDQPVISGTTRCMMVVRAFAQFRANIFPFAPIAGPLGVSLGAANANDLEIPFTCNIIAEMVEDKVFGDPVNPSPAARAGAQLKLGAREIGTTVEGREIVEVVSSRIRKKEW